MSDKVTLPATEYTGPASAVQAAPEQGEGAEIYRLVVADMVERAWPVAHEGESRGPDQVLPALAPLAREDVMTAVPAPPAPAPGTAMCECSHHWGVHAASGQTANTATCHGYTGSATPGPLREPCRCTGFRPWAGPWDSRTGEPVKPLMVTTAPAP